MSLNFKILECVKLMLIGTNQKNYFESRNLKSISDCLLFETVLKNIIFATMVVF